MFKYFKVSDSGKKKKKAINHWPRHWWQYHSLIALAIFSVTFIQWPWNHSLHLSQPLWEKDVIQIKLSVWTHTHSHSLWKNFWRDLSHIMKQLMSGFRQMQ